MTSSIKFISFSVSRLSDRFKPRMYLSKNMSLFREEVETILSSGVGELGMASVQHFVRVDFHHFKAFENFTLYLRNFNILVGPNNAGNPAPVHVSGNNLGPEFRLYSPGNRVVRVG